MLYNIAIIGLAVLIPSFFLAGFRWGVRFGTDKEKAAKEPIVQTPKKKLKETNTQRIKRIEMENIENYHNPWSKQEDLK